MLIEHSSPAPSEFELSRSELDLEEIHFITQSGFNDLVRDTKISKETAEIIGSRLKQWNLVADDFKITSQRKRYSTEPFSKHFIMHEDKEKKNIVIEMTSTHCLVILDTLMFQKNGGFL